MLSPGEELLNLCAQAKEGVVLVSPFVKSAALQRVLEVIPEENTTITCVARWRPEEIAAGACDVEIFDVIRQRPRARLFIHPLLHAKFFRVDDRCLLGSANLTKRALGWMMPANLELLFEVPAETYVLRRFEQVLFSTAFEASEALRNEMESAAKDLQSEGLTTRVLSEEGIPGEEVAFPASGWLPLCTMPELLYTIYSGKDSEDIVQWTFDSGQRDLEMLRIPSRLSRAAFHKYVAASIQQAPFIQHVYEVAARDPITPQEGENLIRSEVDEQDLYYSPEQHWDTVRKWLLFFLPRVYRQPYGSNDLQRGAEIGEWWA